MGYSPGRNNSNRNSPPESELFSEDTSVRVAKSFLVRIW